MSKAKEMGSEMIHPPEKDVIQVLPKEGPFDLAKGIKMVTTKHPYEKPGVDIIVSEAVAAKFKANGWAK
jgi:hypothetical protein